MSEPRPTTTRELVLSIDSAWKDLLSFLSDVTPVQASARDSAGWSVKDHVSHMAVWEDSVAVLFRGGHRHEALGIEESAYAGADFDEINEFIRGRFETLPHHQAIQQLERVHTDFMSHLRALTDPDLKSPVREFFPRAPRADDRPLTSLIWDNTAGHFTEHLEWMRKLVGGAD